MKNIGAEIKRLIEARDAADDVQAEIIQAQIDELMEQLPKVAEEDNSDFDLLMARMG
jgi:hypothetical protein